ncbi:MULTISPECIES: ChbG/HpnK family deacetylase [Pedobacter]|uniref:ChbG/HpnK family deacetylase n=1 Tax=Pedobacter TaxID=84567 RepID=UPI00120C6AAE|nr:MULTISPECIES: ChbG/HpnK family deacetylase [Pedobacter]RZJ87342.1 MAG: ChbG/HpnK family deacetylase [Chryseobacterium sp.]
MGNIILTSDDFGLSKIYNREILLALQSDLLTSVSIMVNGQLSRQQKQVLSLKLLAKEKNISLGLHLEIESNEIDIKQLCLNQWHEFVNILGLEPDYIDIHKDHLFRNHYDDIAEFCVEKHVAFRKYKETTIQLKAPDDMFIASSESLNNIEERLNVIKSDETLEMVFHLGMYDEDVVSSLNKERAEDRKKLEWAHQVINKLGLKIMSYNELK